MKSSFHVRGILAITAEFVEKMEVSVTALVFSVSPVHFAKKTLMTVSGQRDVRMEVNALTW